MGALQGGAILGVLALIVLIILAPLIIYHFLVAPNVIGVFEDFDFYNADKESAHFLYWFWFWSVAFSTTITFLKINSRNNQG